MLLQQGEERGGWSDRGRPRSSEWIVPRGGRRAWRRGVCADSDEKSVNTSAAKGMSVRRINPPSASSRRKTRHRVAK